MLAGVALGAIAIQGLYAQGKPPVYVVLDTAEITNLAGERANAGRSIATLEAISKPFGGRSLARTEQITVLDGTAPKRFTILAFDNAEKAKGWYNSPEQKKVNEIRIKNSKSRVFIVEDM
jgi:uncharacterized protein (DUF1330 family)